MPGLSLGLKAKLFGHGLEARGLGLATVLGLGLALPLNL